MTPQQARAFAFIKDRIRTDGVCPSYTEIAVACGITSKGGVHRLLTALEERGMIRRRAGHARSIQILDPDRLSRFSDAELFAELQRRRLAA